MCGVIVSDDVRYWQGVLPQNLPGSKFDGPYFVTLEVTDVPIVRCKVVL